jgi:methylenetetrahydrofolate dehydrogenase (NADP+) / methenyltetrahydrofolate cyclohydrolase
MENRPLILDGKRLASVVARTLLETTDRCFQEQGRRPKLAVILVGEDPASKTYVAAKHRFAKRCGVETVDITLPASIAPEQLAEEIARCNADSQVDGILLQLPLPKPLDGAHFTRLIAPDKDADGLHPVNQGLLLQGLPAPRACTPLGVMKLLDVALSGLELNDDVQMSDIPEASLAGKRAVVIGRSQLVGKPVGVMLLERNATVTYVHSKTANIEKICSEAEIVVAAVGVPNLVKSSWVKSGAVVIDVGINRTAEGALVGDVDFESVAPMCSAITPVPGGVGPMTVAMLMSNTVDNFKRSKVSKL